MAGKNCGRYGPWCWSYLDWLVETDHGQKASIPEAHRSAEARRITSMRIIMGP